jgi:outer membrane protein, multidrug efflux system
MSNPSSIAILPSAVSRLSLVVLTVLMTGCISVGADYVRPEIPVYNEWNTHLQNNEASREEDIQSMAVWWTTLDDPLLSALIDRAVKGNLDLKKGRTQVREARALRGIAIAGFLPALQGGASATSTRTSKDTGDGKTSDLYSATFDASWELDLFGGVRRSVEAAQGDLQASEENLRDVLVSLLAEVALNYLDVRTTQDRLHVAEFNLESQNETYQLAQWRYQAGLSDELAVEQARYNLENTRSQIPVLRTSLEEAMNRVAVLLGEQPGKVHKALEQPSPIPVPPLKLAVGVPADLLRRRPDVRKAERELAAQTARIGVATAELYPKLTLLGSIGLETLSISNPSAGLASLSGGPRITWAIFKGGAIRQNIEAQSALQEEALIQYEGTILSALEEVENALVAYIEVQQRRRSLSEATRAAQHAAELARQKYEAGLTDFTVVLDAQRSLLSFHEQLAISNGNVTSNLVRLYKALGGGWTPEE